MSVCADVLARTRLLRQGRFWFFLLAIAGFKLLVNGYLTGREIVIYNPQQYLGIRVGSIPLEDFLFGFSMVTFSIVVWERLTRRGS
jgi:lycopene cyclase domain-containing protein